MTNKILIVGCDDLALERARMLIGSAAIVVAGKFSSIKIDEPKPFIIKRHEIEPIDKVWIDKNEPIYNWAKHIATCAKNRKKRKSKRK